MKIRDISLFTRLILILYNAHTLELCRLSIETVEVNSEL